MPKTEIKPIFVRLSALERRRIRTLAVSQGMTMREAMVHAFSAWAAQLRSGSPPKPGARRQPSGRPAKDQRRAEPGVRQSVRHPAEVRSAAVASSATGNDLFPGISAWPEDWPATAAQLDWSSCPAAESVQTKQGNIWVAAGTLVPLTHVFEAVDGDNPLAEIADVYQLSLQQIVVLLQFAANAMAGGTAER